METVIPRYLVFRENNHLGDTLAVAYALERLSFEHDIPFIHVAGLPPMTEVVAALQLQRVKACSLGEWWTEGDPLLQTRNWDLPWIDSVYYCLRDHFHAHNEKPFALGLPKHENKTNFVLSQFDSRSVMRIDGPDAVQILLKLSPRELVKIIGGPDTVKYMGIEFDYLLGNLTTLVKHLLECRMYVGSDSGIGHLAGILGIPSIIVTKVDSTFDIFRQYPTVKVVRKDHFGL